MFGYTYGIKTNERDEKILDISVGLNYLESFSGYCGEITADIIEKILEDINPIKIIQDYIEAQYEEWNYSRLY